MNHTKIERIRISSLGIEYINDNLIKIFENSRIYAHLHLSIQSWSDKILKLMNRNYDRKFLIETLEKLNSIKREDGVMISIWADIIVWFPQENDNDFKDTLNLIEKYNITKVHAFPFSAHENRDFIPASKFPNQVKNHIKMERLRMIIRKWDEVRINFLKQNSWNKFKLLVEKVSNKWVTWLNWFSWWSENYIFLNERNFKVESQIEIWKIVEWTFIYDASVIEKLESQDW